LALLSAGDKNKIVEAVQDAEKETSGEIRVHVERFAGRDVLDRAMDVFEKLKVYRTRQRNGVLIYLAMTDRRFAILGDAGIDFLVPNGFWDEIRDAMETEFQQERFVEGICLGVAMAGKALAEYFPYYRDDKNELSDEVSIGE
jgi:uncharacterized membrane protein